MQTINLAEKLSLFSDHWHPRIVGELNGQQVKLVKLQGEFIWHSHPDTDELFLVVSGHLVIQLRDGDVTLGPGDVYVVPRGVEHCPRADGEVSALLIEPQGTVNTGDTPSERTAQLQELDL